MLPTLSNLPYPRSQENPEYFPFLHDHSHRPRNQHQAHSRSDDGGGRPSHEIVHNPNLERPNMASFTVPVASDLRIRVDGEIDALLRRAGLARVPEEQRLFRRHALAVRIQLDSACQLLCTDEASGLVSVVSASSARRVGGAGVGWRRFQTRRGRRGMQPPLSHDNDATLIRAGPSWPTSPFSHVASLAACLRLAVLTLVHKAARP